jgi:hypothetical protein
VSKHKFKSSYKDVIYQVYKENWGKQMLKHSEGKLCSYSKFKTYFGQLQILARISSFSLLRSQYNFCSALRTWKFWQILLILLNISVLQMLKHSEGKLCSYSKFKTYFGLEKYVCILKSFEQRRNFTRFRISSDRLQIERGRY